MKKLKNTESAQLHADATDQWTDDVMEDDWHPWALIDLKHWDIVILILIT